MQLKEEDIEDIKTILYEIKGMCIKFDYHDEKTANFVYDIDMATRAILEIIEGPKGGIEKMF